MIENEKQYNITKKWVSEFTDAIEALNSHSEKTPMKTMMIKGLESQRETLRQEINEYEQKFGL